MFLHAAREQKKTQPCPAEPNPFLSDFGGGHAPPVPPNSRLPSGPSLEGEAGIFGEGGGVFGGISSSPARPPPPNKSAFDDLNESIRAALGGSPARSASSPTHGNQAPGGLGTSPHQMQFNVGGTPPVVFGSPARQGSGDLDWLLLYICL
jgi:hypothetical protein